MSKASMTGMGRYFLLTLVFLTGCVTGAGPATSPLAGFYGFGDLEILKLGGGLQTPLICDINHDGLNDLILLNNRSSRIDLLLQKRDFDPAAAVVEPQEEDINDIFAREKNWRFKRVFFPLDWQVDALTVGDFNGDQLTDLALYTREGLRLVLQDQRDPASAGAQEPAAPAWQPDRKIDIRDGLASPQALAAGDLNGDGRTDLAVLAGDGVYILLHQPDGRLADPVRYYSAGTKLRQVNLRDIDGDGRHDLVLLSGTVEECPVRVRLQSDRGTLGPEIRLAMPFALALETAPLDPAGGKCWFASISAKSQRVVVHSLSQRPQKLDKPVLTYPLPATAKNDSVDMAAADLNGDGLLDMVVTNPEKAEFTVLLADGRGGLADPETFPGFRDMRKIVAFRQPGEERDRLAVLSFDEKLIGLTGYENGRLTYPQTVQLAGEPQVCDVMDYDADGRPDLVYVYVDRDENKRAESKAFLLGVISNLGSGSEKPLDGMPVKSLQDKPTGLCGVDVDHNGHADVIIFQPFKPLLLWRNPEGEVLGKAINAGLVSDVAPRALSVAALGPQGRPACLIVQKNYARAIVFDPDKGWQVVDQFQAEQANANLTAALAWELDEAARGLEIVTFDNARGQLAILASDADGIYRAGEQIETGAILERKILAGPFGGGGDSLMLCGSDKLIQIPLAGQVVVASQLAAWEAPDEKTRYGLLTVGDLNGDGWPELAAVDQAGNHIDLLAFNGQAELVRGYRMKVFEEADLAHEEAGAPGQRGGGEPHGLIVGDVTGDGKNDLIVMVHDRLIIYPQD